MSPNLSWKIYFQLGFKQARSISEFILKQTLNFWPSETILVECHDNFIIESMFFAWENLRFQGIYQGRIQDFLANLGDFLKKFAQKGMSVRPLRPPLWIRACLLPWLHDIQILRNLHKYTTVKNISCKQK